jgi:carbonic anhydrase
MKKLIRGLREFKETYVSTHRDFLEHLAHGQKPRVLFITCSDSRIVPSLITQTEPGEIFVIRNAGNIIPPFGAANGGEGAAVEYAIHALGIEQIIVCGHSHCGAMKGLLQIGKLEEEMPLVYQWLRHSDATRRLVQENYQGYSKDELLEIAIAETGEVLAYDPLTHQYLPPQTQLETVGEPGRFLATSAPPITCDLPAYDPEDLSAPAPIPVASKPTSSNGQVAYKSSPGNISWLPPEQADRIYRGTATRSS